jgi:hypothetical protein
MSPIAEMMDGFLGKVEECRFLLGISYVLAKNVLVLAGDLVEFVRVKTNKFFLCCIYGYFNH